MPSIDSSGTAMRTCRRSGDSVHICSGGPNTEISSLMFSPPAPRSAVLVGIGLAGRRGAGFRRAGFRLGALPGFLLGGGLFGVLDRLEAVALATFEFVVRLACHGLGLLVVRVPSSRDDDDDVAGYHDYALMVPSKARAANLPTAMTPRRDRRLRSALSGDPGSCILDRRGADDMADRHGWALTL